MFLSIHTSSDSVPRSLKDTPTGGADDTSTHEKVESTVFHDSEIAELDRSAENAFRERKKVIYSTFH